MRPPKCRYVEFDPSVTVFKPRGVPSTELEMVELQLDELEAIRLADLERLHHAVAGARMGISRATFGRLIEQARAKVAEALIQGKTLRFRGGDVAAARELAYDCRACGENFTIPPATRLPVDCPACRSRRTEPRGVPAGRGSG